MKPKDQQKNMRTKKKVITIYAADINVVYKGALSLFFLYIYTQLNTFIPRMAEAVGL